MPYAPRATLDNPYGPQVTFRTEDVLPPSAYYISPEDQVTVWVMTDKLAQTIFLQLRMLMPTGEIKLIPYQFAPPTTNTWSPVYELPPWEGYLLGAMCWSSAPQRGQCYVSVQVMRSAPPNLQRAGAVLLQGYISNLSVLSYPTSQLEACFSGRGAFLTITQPNQTGVNLDIVVPLYVMWRVYSLQFTLVTSAAAGNRVVNVQLHDSNNQSTGVWQAGIVQAPSSALAYTFAPGSANTTVGPYATIGGPTEVYLGAQGSLQTFVQGLDAGDAFSSIAMGVEEWVGQ